MEARGKRGAKGGRHTLQYELLPYCSLSSFVSHINVSFVPLSPMSTLSLSHTHIRSRKGWGARWGEVKACHFGGHGKVTFPPFLLLARLFPPSVLSFSSSFHIFPALSSPSASFRFLRSVVCCRLPPLDPFPSALCASSESFFFSFLVSSRRLFLSYPPFSSLSFPFDSCFSLLSDFLPLSVSPLCSLLPFSLSTPSPSSPTFPSSTYSLPHFPPFSHSSGCPTNPRVSVREFPRRRSRQDRVPGGLPSPAVCRPLLYERVILLQSIKIAIETVSHLKTTPPVFPAAHLFGESLSAHSGDDWPG